MLIDSIDNLYVGFDFGTTYCCAAVLNTDKRTVVLEDCSESQLTRSAICYEGAAFTLGEKAMAGDRPITLIKRLMGHQLEDPAVQLIERYLPYRLKGRPDGIYIEVATDEYKHVEVVAADMLKGMLDEYSRTRGQAITGVVMAVPRDASLNQARAVTNVCKLAGVNLLGVMKQPTVAVAAHCLREEQYDHHVLVYDMGGGTLDVYIVCIDQKRFKMLRGKSALQLGGADFDNLLADHVYDRLALQGERVHHNLVLSRACELAKLELSSADLTTVRVTGRSEEITLSAFEGMIRPLIDVSLRLVDDVVRAADIEKVDRVLLLGGSSQIPLIGRLMRQRFPASAFGECDGAGTYIAEGCAIVAATRAKLPHRLLPRVQDSVVRPIGIDTITRTMDVVILADSQHPCCDYRVFATSRDYQESIPVLVYEGFNAIAAQNDMIASVTVPVPRAPAGEEFVKVFFTFDSNGVFSMLVESKAGVISCVDLARGIV